MPSIRHTYIAQTQPGFEAIAATEITARIDGAQFIDLRSVADKNGMVRFAFSGDPRDLLQLRTVEDVFVVAAEARDLAPGFAALRQLAHLAATASGIERAVHLVRRIDPRRGGEGRIHYRVIARQVGRMPYRRVDTQVAVERGIAARPDHRWRLVADGGIEFWLVQWPGEALLMVRLSDERMRHRDYKVEHLPASLRPAAAAALAWLTTPRDDDRFLDPMCGAGTILIERAYLGRYRALIGGDIDPEAVATARANIGSRYKPVSIHEWDARRLPLDAGSVTALAVNLPFGAQMGSLEENRTLYPEFLREAARVLRPGARLVALSGDARTLSDALRRNNRLVRRATYPVLILGRRAVVVVAERG
ncbi:methyltransferase domain-containing protein [Roseiflexus castenholzii]|uniref:methyltransferase domain-containing protein n=1 Tax=Roseiflexus castenholzii TaxID=120962 RepID=UPI003C7C82BC